MSGDERQMFRAMRAESDGLPSIGRSARQLGVRVEGSMRDIPVEANGAVSPGTGGMSVAVDDARNLPKHRRPRSLDGEGRDPVFRMPRDLLEPALTLRIDRHPHALVEPAGTCPWYDYEAALGATRPSWDLLRA